jgi:hypothetical protein
MEFYRPRVILKKKWFFRKNHLKNIDYFPKINKLILLRSEKKDIKITNSFNLKFTKFSIYFKISKFKHKNLSYYNRFAFLLYEKEKLKIFKTMKKNQIFSIYKKNLSNRSNLKIFLINLLGNFKIYNNPNFPPKSKTKKNWNYNQFSKEKFKNLLDFKRKELLFIRSSKILKLNMIKNINKLHICWIENKKEYFLFSKKSYNIFKKLIFVNFFWEIFFKTTIDQNFKFIQSDQINTNTISSKNFYSKLRFLYQKNFNLKVFEIQKKCTAKILKNKKQYISRNYKLKIFFKLANLLKFLMPGRKNGFNFIISFSLKLGWRLKYLSLDIIYFCLKKPLKKSLLIFNFISKFFSYGKLFFLKEIYLILIFLIGKKNILLISYFSFNKFLKIPALCNYSYEIQQSLMVLSAHKISINLVSPNIFDKIKKKYWYKNFNKIFWYIFSKFQPSFFISRLVHLQLKQKVRKRLSETIVQYHGWDENFKNKEFFLNFLEKKEKRNQIYKKKTIKRTKINKYLIYKKLLKKEKKNSTFHGSKFEKHWKSKCHFKSKSKFPGYMSLKKIIKSKNLLGYSEKKSKPILLFKKSKEPINSRIESLKKKFDSKKFFLDFPEKIKNSKNIIRKNFFKIKWEIIGRSGFLFFEKKNLLLTFLCNLKIWKINQKILFRRLDNYKPFLKIKFRNRTIFISNFKKSLKRRNFLGSNNYCFFLEKRFLKIRFNFKLIKEFIDKKIILKKVLTKFSMFYLALKKETFYIGNFFNPTIIIYQKTHIFLFDVIKYFFQLFLQNNFF